MCEICTIRDLRFLSLEIWDSILLARLANDLVDDAYSHLLNLGA
jgi:hypothetical protein